MYVAKHGMHCWSNAIKHADRKVIDANSILFVLSKNSRKSDDIIELVYSQNGSDRKAYIIICNIYPIIVIFYCMFVDYNKIKDTFIIFDVKVGLLKKLH